ncbi:uncharacterized protein N7484_000487 [Penicillium longicatenatum]|uniref:uncharacterized protein n=1 Tax=Penicillium longicatenatum TaxID=1561947 RepID=UPI002546A505|nr:uncharacterized protein N7484_000487 [Penicillium longicatenatum]KAJ5661115.1 hypothetical protein N7484_000487 [Penicillium longicatenatum]
MTTDENTENTTSVEFLGSLRPLSPVESGLEQVPDPRVHPWIPRPGSGLDWENGGCRRKPRIINAGATPSAALGPGHSTR